MSVPAERRRVRQWWHEFASEVPQGFQVIEAAVSMKCLDHDGKVCLVNTKSESLNPWEAIGMHVSAQDDLRQTLQSACEEDDD